MVQARIDSYRFEKRITPYDLSVWHSMIDAASTVNDPQCEGCGQYLEGEDLQDVRYCLTCRRAGIEEGLAQESGDDG